jgi:hypothetical protein
VHIIGLIMPIEARQAVLRGFQEKSVAEKTVSAGRVILDVIKIANLAIGLRALAKGERLQALVNLSAAAYVETISHQNSPSSRFIKKLLR